MHNIIWKRPDNGVSVTTIQPATVERWAIANSYAELVPQKAALAAAKEAAIAEIAALQAQIVALVAPQPPVIPEGATEEEEQLLQAQYQAAVAAFQQARADLEAQQATLQPTINDAVDKLRKIEFYELVEFNEGLDSQSHAAMLQRADLQPDGTFAADIPAAYEAVAFDIAVPADREFRAAWTWTTPDPVIDIDMNMAAEVTKDRLRRERATLFDALDIEFNRCLETRADTTIVVANKQKLRDVTMLATPSKTLDELRALHPSLS